MADEEGASPRELILEACRRNNTDLLEGTIADLAAAASTAGKAPAAHVAQVLNDARDGLGNGCLHVAASYGSYEVLDMLLDQEGLEIELADRIEGDLPLHKAVRYANSLPPAARPAGTPIVEILLDAGCDPRIRNKAKLKPGELVDPRNVELREVLRKGEVAMMMGGDVVHDDEGDAGSASDSE
ncbi:ankyrin repeat domain-containing protein [Didymella exigua CBS 183.55]|uniref:Ankyrin repeat domain-containing protein n=1 Tax=Didymella exigua CBS 183.55 TaxID=1150837 RepID=A0A6A5REC2_9PLEO|nr:ankyrin repeat domain-containing protein [Didymella exigua CBS 183.55]KAF1925578.1 ankyrin repeat domain-containing protein [Didymella exigua CBS 183.55]